MNKTALLALLALLVAAVFYWDLTAYLSLEQFSAQRENIEQWRDQWPLLAAALYFLIYVVITALSLPGAAVMTLVGGALFGLAWGTLLVSFASSLGALLAFTIARALLHDWVQKRFGNYLSALNRGVERDGHFYLFSLRLVPAVPFFVLNLAMALTPMRPWPFYWVSQLGMLPATAVFVNAGTQLARVDSVGDILSVPLLLSFAALALFPWLARAVARVLQRRRALRGFQRPRRFDHNLLVIGAGAAGLVSAYIAAQVRAGVALIERERMGGDCLNTGCVPSKALLRSARIARYVQRAPEFGVSAAASGVDFKAVMARVQRVIAAIEPHDSVARYSELGVNCISGDARIISPWEVEVDGQRLSARNIIVASGGRPALPPIPGIEDCRYLTSDTVWGLQQCPERLLVLGAGPIGCELAQAFARLGAQVTVVELFELLPREDGEVAQAVREQFAAEGIELLEHSRALGFENGDTLLIEQPGENGAEQRRLHFDQLLVATGRRANVDGLGLETVGVQLRKNGTIEVDRYLRTACPTIYACGDVTGPYQLTHAGAHQAWYAAVNSLFGGWKKFAVDYSVIPAVTFCDPEVARVGLNEREAEARGVAFEVTRYELDDLDRAIADGEARGFVKVLTAPGRDKILGATIVGYRAGELLGEFVLAMKQGIGLNKILGTIHPYPTMAEANKYTAGQWRAAHKPERLLALVERYHRWRRG